MWQMPVGVEIPAVYTIICWFEIFFFSVDILQQQVSRSIFVLAFAARPPPLLSSSPFPGCD